MDENILSTYGSSMFPEDEMSSVSKDAIAARLREIVYETKATRQQMGDVVGCSPQAVQKWLKSGKIAQENMAILCDYYGYSFLWLLTGQGPKHPADINDVPVVTPTPSGQSIRIDSEGSSLQAKSLAGRILAMSASGELSDARIAAIESLLEPSYPASIDSDVFAGLRRKAAAVVAKREQTTGRKLSVVERRDLIYQTIEEMLQPGHSDSEEPPKAADC